MSALVLVSIVSCSIAAGVGPAAAQETGWFVPPVDAAITERFDPPTDPYGPGHRGVDYSAAAMRVRASASGTVTFAGAVADSLFVTVAHGSGIETTYSRLARIWVERGQVVDQGTWLGLTGTSHPGTDGLHFGVRVDGEYVDPTSWLGPIDVSGAIHLAPLVWEPSTQIPEPLRAALMPRSAGDSEAICEARRARTSGVVPPNANVAVAVAGIGSRTAPTVAADMYEYGPSFMGYPPQRIYEFSYKGSRGPDFHEPYRSKATFKDLNASARELNGLLTAIARRHPGRDVDLIAHSQGGIVARTWLALQARSFDPAVPHVAHLVTFSTPHRGAPAAGEVEGLARSTHTGAALLHKASGLARTGAPIPDPLSAAVGQMAPGSSHMQALAREDVLFGTRVLTLGIPNDVVVPADKTAIPGELHRVVTPQGLNGHSAIVASPEARGLAYDFLRGAADSCPGGWDRWGPTAGGIVSWLESNLAEGFRWGESVALRIPPP